MSLNLDITLVIPVRQGSLRVKGKNTRPFFQSEDGVSHSLLSWKLTQLTNVVSPEKILVTSDSKIALGVAAEFGTRTHDRDPRLASADAPFAELVESCASIVSSLHMGWVTVTSPFIGPTAISNFLAQYEALEPVQQDSGMISVNRVQSYVLCKGSPLNFELGRMHKRSQDLEAIEIAGWGLMARSTKSVLRESYMYGLGYTSFPLDFYESIDIDDSEQFQTATELAKGIAERKYGLQ